MKMRGDERRENASQWTRRTESAVVADAHPPGAGGEKMTGEPARQKRNLVKKGVTLRIA